MVLIGKEWGRRMVISRNSINDKEVLNESQ